MGEKVRTKTINHRSKKKKKRPIELISKQSKEPEKFFGLKPKVKEEKEKRQSN